ncbi:MAG: cell division protein FtsA [candidate division KSB1 bacterium]|nr:cell division protein FtsA [candidate division KSB1 bacterium]MDZ7333876.1 cell division protein FtsA [candidate division KSB1 bacterium]MDZ7358470.1 cell division protein FtsA [candidate division KSB1 bacterium]MDZ7399122.1 cell division protein FtsA [candidate division KSB1 bacterium]
MSSPELITGLDIGTTKIGVIIAEVEDDSQPKVIGVGTAPSEGLRKGVVVNVEKTVRSIENAVIQAEQMAGVKIDQVYVGIAGDHIRSYNGRGVVAVAGPDNEITEDDVRRVIDAAKAVVMPIDREIIHIIPQEFIVDDQRGIKDPLGMSGIRLETEVHIVTGAITSAQNICRSVERAGLNVSDLVLEPLASSYSVLSEDEKELGVVVMDMGGGTTDIAMFFEGCIRHTAVVALGGGNVTNDIALCLRTPVDQAEMIKIKYGCALHSLLEDQERTIEIPGVGGRPARKVAQELLVDIIHPRMEEIFRLAAGEIRKSEFANLMTAGVVITGGAALIKGAVELAEEVFDMPVKLGIPKGFSGLIDLAKSPIHATGVGLILYALANRYELETLLTEGGEIGLFEKIWDRMKSWFN